MEEATEQVKKTTPKDDKNTSIYEKTSESNTIIESEKIIRLLGVTYKNEDRDLTFQLKTPDANGYTIEITLNGATYTEVTFDKDTFVLSNVTITEEGISGSKQQYEKI